MQTEGKIVREGHLQTLRYMAGVDFINIKKAYENQQEIGGVYFRPRNGDLAVVDLNPRSKKPRIGIGNDYTIKAGERAIEHEKVMGQRISEWIEKRKKESISYENQFEARLIREAQANQLKFPAEFSPGLRFIHSQWRVDSPDTLKKGEPQKMQFTDLLAVDLNTSSLVIVELKCKQDHSAIQQAKRYLTYFQKHEEKLNSFFLQLAQVMGVLYACNELAALSKLRRANLAYAAWPKRDNDVMGAIYVSDVITL